MSTSVASARLIGRDTELAELEAALTGAAEGRPSLAFVAGESGVGKTRLLTELMRRAGDDGTLVLAGETLDLGGEGELPYLPLVAALRPLARGGDPALTDALRAGVAPLLPGPDSETADPDQGGGDATGQARLFEALLSLLDALGRERPVLLVIEDLHWADRSTRAALAFLARSLTSERVLIVASYRSDELHRRHPLRPLLAELERGPHARRVALEPLTRDELAAQLADILGAAPAADLLERLWSRCGGNPLFGEELLAAGLDGRGAAPDTLRDALMLRVERLSEPAQDLLRLVAVGRRLDHAVLEAASALDPRELRAALREAVEGHILAVADDDAYRFRHALLREVVEDDLLPGERSELHLTLAHALEPRLEADGGAQTAAAVAHHFAAAGDEPAALAAAVRAATAAERVHAYGEAAALLERALELWPRVPDAEARAGAGRVALLARAADATGALGDPARQLALLEAAFGGLDAAAEPARAARILESTARAQRHLNRARASIATLERGLELVERGDGDPAVLADLLAGLARARMIVAHFGDAIRVAREALEAAAAAGLPVVEGRARDTLGFALAMTGDVEAGTAELRDAIRIAREHDDRQGLGEAYNNYAEVLHTLGRSDEARAMVAEGRQAVAGRWPIAMAWLDARLAEIAFDVGEWELSEASLPDPRRWTGLQARVGIELRKAALALGRGDHAAAAARLEEVEPLAADSSEPQVLGGIGAVAAELRRREGELEAARAAAGAWLARIAYCREDATGVSALSLAGVSIEADAAERARDVGDAEAEAAALSRIEPLIARLDAAAGAGRPVEHAALLSARAEATRAAGRPDAARCEAAAAAWDDAGRPEPAARMRWREAEAHVAARDRDPASEAARAAHGTASRLGAGWLRGEIEGLAARARLALEAASPEPAEPPEETPFGLTARERQVLALLADGASNREIGATLFMAEKTASVHVSRILSKLNARSRTEAAAVAHRHRLAHPFSPDPSAPD
jgi:DNA-binding CsgD family transcriptional regulator/tetratricopeptide (TPR) repeat protein